MRKFDKDKYLRKLRFKKYKRYLYMGIPCFLVLLIGIYFAYSKFSVSKDTEVVRTTVGEFISGDIVITPYIDGEYSKEFPKEEPGINVEKVLCDNDAVGKWDEDNRQLKVTNLTKRTKCNVYFVTPKSCGINDNVKCISNREEFATLANEVNNGDNKSGKIYYLTSDIDLGGKFDSSGNALDGNISWTPIGTEDKPFSGMLDGSGHVISNMYVNRPNDNDNGLFGNAENGIMKNIGVKLSFIRGKADNGGIVGVSGVIKNSFSLVTINSAVRSGGICGSWCFIKNSYNGGNITNTSGDLTGGLSGGWGTMINSYNYGTITTSATSIGGIVGWDGNAYNCYNLGIISGVGYAVGGIIGGASSGKQLINNYNSGKVTGQIGGGILGGQYQLSDYTKFDVVMRNNYYLNSTASYGIGAYSKNDNASPLEASQMPSVISVINGDNAFVEDTNNINNGYPILKWQANR